MQIATSTQVTLSGLAARSLHESWSRPRATRTVAQSFDLTHTAGPIEERLYLWPRDWVAIVVRTSDGRPFTELARELGLEPKSLFVGRFLDSARDATRRATAAPRAIPTSRSSVRRPATRAGSCRLGGRIAATVAAGADVDRPRRCWA
jgi:hypothetical protein